MTSRYREPGYNAVVLGLLQRWAHVSGEAVVIDGAGQAGATRRHMYHILEGKTLKTLVLYRAADNGCDGCPSVKNETCELAERLDLKVELAKHDDPAPGSCPLQLGYVLELRAHEGP